MRTMACVGAVAAVVLGLSAAPPTGGAADKAAAVECRRAAGAITLDGTADEPAWAAAPPITDFGATWAGRKAQSATEARLLWDDTSIYFTATMQDVDLYADVTERNGTTWYNDVFELFFKPSPAKKGYYEFQVNALNTPFETYLPSRGAGGVTRFLKQPSPGLKSAVKLRGTLNDLSDTDRGWTVEGRIPWTGFAPTGGKPKAGDRWRFALCRYDYSVAYDDPDLSSTAPLRRPSFHQHEDYGELLFVGGKE
jgi:hypothetical protein